MRKALFLLMLSGLLLSCRNDNNQDVSKPEQNVETRKEIKEVSQEPAVIKDTIEVYQPQAGEIISSPLKIEGRARGTWFFEASFAVRLLNQNGNEIAVVPAEAQEDWMTEDWVPFEATLEFDDSGFEEGVLIFEKANPSGLEERDRELRIPVKFKSR